MLNIRKFLKAIGLIPKTSSEINAQGEMEVLSTDGKLRYHDGSSVSPVVTEAHSATLTNKSLDADTNTITNIENADIKSGAAIDAAKIANGSVSSIEFQYLDGVTSSIQTQLNSKQSNTLTDAHILVGNGSNVATDVALSGDISIDNTGNAQIVAGTIVNADVNSAAAISYSKLNLTDAISNADVSSVAAIARTKLASGTANHVIINDGSGVLSSEATLDETRGGTGQTTLATGDLLYASGANTLSKLSIGSTSQVLTVTAGVPTWAAATGGGGGGTATKSTLIARGEADGTVTDNCTISTVSNKTRVVLTSPFIYTTGLNSTDTKGDLSVRVNGQEIERKLTSVNDATGNVVYDEVSTTTIDVYEITSSSTTAAIASGIPIAVERVTYNTTDLQAFSTSIIPFTNASFDIGSSTSRIRDLYLSANTLHIGTDATNEGLIKWNSSTSKLQFKHLPADAAFQDFGSGGGGSGEVNFVGMTTAWASTNTDDSTAEATVGNWVAYADAAGSSPVDMTGGSPTVTIARTTTAGEIMNGTASFKLTKGASNLQGQGASVVLNVPPAYQGKTAKIQIPFKISSGSLVSGDLKVFIYDVTNSIVITPYNNDVIGSTGTIYATFPVPASATTPANIQMRVGFHFASTSATAVTLQFDDVIVGPQTKAIAPAAADWVEQSGGITFNGTGSNPTKTGSPLIDKFIWRRVGDSMECRFYYSQNASGTGGTGDLLIKLPTGYTIDTTKFNFGSTSSGRDPNRIIGTGRRGNDDFATGWNCFFHVYDSTRIRVVDMDGVFVYSFASAGILGNVNPMISGMFTVPIVGWSSNITIGQSSTFNISSYLANGTRVTTTPTKLGEYRTLVKDSGAVSTYSTDTDGSSKVSTADGMRFYVHNGNGAGTSTEPNRWLIFVGKNKKVTPQFYASAGRTGQAHSDFFYYSAGTTEYGFFHNYDPTTGIFMITETCFVSASSNRTIMTYTSETGANNEVKNIYFDLIVSENALAVGTDQVRSSIHLGGANGSGSTNTKILRFGTTHESIGNAITYADSATLGGSFTINEDGIYSVFINAFASTSNNYFGISVSTSAPTTAMNSLTYAQGHRGFVYLPSGTTQTISRTMKLNAGDIVRFHHDGQTFDTGTVYTQMSVTKVSN